MPRLISQLYEENIFISIGHRDFKIPRELFSDPGNSPNYFSLGFAIFFSTPSEVFPGLDRQGLLRPPSILPPSVPSRSADTFAEILHLLRGYPIHIRNEDHRSELLSDCRYFHLKGLEQKIIHHHISFNVSRHRQEIVLRLEDIRQSGISIVGDPSSASSPSLSPSSDHRHPSQTTSNHGITGWVNYARPFTDSQAHELILEIGGSCTRLHLGSMRVEFFNEGLTRISRLFEVIATKLNLPTTQPLGLLMARGGATSAPASPGNTPISEDLVRVVLDAESAVWVDGKEWHVDTSPAPPSTSPSAPPPPPAPPTSPPRKRRKADTAPAVAPAPAPIPAPVTEPTTPRPPPADHETWIVKTGQWRLRVQNARTGTGTGNGKGKGGVECVLVAVKLDVVSGELGRNRQRGFLAG